VAQTLAEESPLVGRLTRARVTHAGAGRGEAAAHALLADGTEIVMPLGGLIDVEKECARLSAELTQIVTQIEAAEGRLANEKFTSRAPAHVVEAERAKVRDLSARREQLAHKVASLCGDA
ncbi:MAG TPA: hypothetical protein VFS05_01510, partial [Gemmatimonadaceae bacterium]|nr:hypothetical protein [Gemmatimonadaceae bacterium]